MSHPVSTSPPALFHPGELQVQERAGVADVAARVGAGNLRGRLDADFAAFPAQRFYVVAAALAPNDRMWATPLSGRPGFVRAIDAKRVLLDAAPAGDDPLAAALAAGPAPLGLLLALDQATRGRIRLNGLATAAARSGPATSRGGPRRSATSSGGCPW